MNSYERDTKFAYRTKERALEYQRYNAKAFSWGRVATFFEQRFIRRELRRITWSAGDKLLDIPCGTGILSDTIAGLPCRVVISDVSMEMMMVGREEYAANALAGAVQADITQTPFQPASFRAVCVIGFLHRVPPAVRAATLQEVTRLAQSTVVVTCSVDTPVQRLKHRLLSVVRSHHVPAPSPARLPDIIAACEAAGLRLVRHAMAVPLLSSDAVLVLRKVSAS